MIKPAIPMERALQRLSPKNSDAASTRILPASMTDVAVAGGRRASPLDRAATLISSRVGFGPG